MRNQELFELMSREHGLTLLESEMHEIELTVARMLASDREHEAARQDGVSQSESETLTNQCARSIRPPNQ